MFTFVLFFFIILPTMQRLILHHAVFTWPINIAKTIRKQSFKGKPWRTVFDWGYSNCSSRKLFYSYFGSSDSLLGNCWLLNITIHMKISHFKDQLSQNQPVILHFTKLKKATSDCVAKSSLLLSPRKATDVKGQTSKTTRITWHLFKQMQAAAV